MNTALTDAQIARYREDGFVIQEDFLAPEELETWRAALDEALARRGARMLPEAIDNAMTGERTKAEAGEADDSASQYYVNVFKQRVNLWMDNPRMKALILDPAIGKMCCDLEGIDAIRVWHDQALIKEPWGNPTGWHLDNPYWSFHHPHAISIWIALDDATLENGCLYFIPGSHKARDWTNVGIGPNVGDLFKTRTEWRQGPSAAAPMKAGSCSFHNGLTAHGAGANMTPGTRRAMTCAFMPAGAAFNGTQNVLPRAYYESLAVGDELNNDELNPIVYDRRAALAPSY